MAFRLHIEGLRDLSVRSRLLFSGIDWRKLHAALGEAALANSAERFRTGTDPDGQRWPARKTAAGQPLVDSGRLRSSIDFEPTKEHVAVGSSVVYAAVHNFGSRDGNTAARPFLGMGSEMRRDLRQAVTDFMAAR